MPVARKEWLQMKAAAVQCELPRNPMAGIRNFDTSEHVYTEEEPNSLTVEEMPAFLRTSRLRAFAAFAEDANMSRAARRLHLSQPAVHAQLRRLSEALGAPLYQRLGADWS
jgi:hypothetical protein